MNLINTIKETLKANKFETFFEIKNSYTNLEKHSIKSKIIIDEQEIIASIKIDHKPNCCCHQVNVSIRAYGCDGGDFLIFTENEADLQKEIANFEEKFAVAFEKGKVEAKKKEESEAKSAEMAENSFKHFYEGRQAEEEIKAQEALEYIEAQDEATTEISKNKFLASLNMCYSVKETNSMIVIQEDTGKFHKIFFNDEAKYCPGAAAAVIGPWGFVSLKNKAEVNEFRKLIKSKIL